MTSKFALIFDMDGVIIDSNTYHAIALKQFCEKYGHFLTEEQLLKKIYGRTNKEWITNLFGELSVEELKNYAEEKETLFREIYTPYIQPLAGLLDFINQLEQHRIPIAIGTSAPSSNVDFVLKHTGLNPERFTAILDESFVVNGKPNPEIYLKVAKTINFPPERCVVFEDSLSGIKAGNDAGCKVVGVSTTHSAEELNDTAFVIPNFEGLKIDDIAALFS